MRKRPKISKGYFKKEKICPKCRRPMYSYPGLNASSRIDGAEICSDCGRSDTPAA